MAIPSELLENEIISDWKVEKQIETFQGQTGGFFSRGYIVEKGGKKAFLKAMDLHSVLGGSLQQVNEAISQYEFERKLFEMCARSGLSNIVRMLDQGEHIPSSIAHLPNPQFNKVYYLIFEFASGGDIRRELKFDGEKLDSWKLFVLHQIAVALKQLHTIGIAHQDIKPSNVLAFKEEKKYKLTDLGRSSSTNYIAPTDDIPFPGDLKYSPPEYFYRYIPPEYNDRRIGSDLYLLGSMISFLYTGLGALNLTRIFTSQEYWWGIWGGSYKDVLPFLIDAHAKATEALREKLVGNKFQNELALIYHQLCHPDPSLRGHPKTRAMSNHLGLERYVTDFDRYSKDLEITERIRRLASGN